MNDHKKYIKEEKDDDIEVASVVRCFIDGCRKFSGLLPIVILIVTLVGCTVENVLYVPKHTSSVTFALNPAECVTSDGDDDTKSSKYLGVTSDELADSFVSTLNSSLFLRRVAGTLGEESLKAEISAKRIGEESNYITVNVTFEGDDILYPERVMNIIPDVYSDMCRDTIGEINIESFSGGVTSSTSKPVLHRQIIKYAFLAAILWMSAIFLYSVSRDRILSREDMKIKLGKSCIASLPRAGRRCRGKRVGIDISEKSTNPLFTESVKLLAAKLVKEISTERGRIFVVTSTSAKEGKTTIAVNLAAAVSGMGYSVVLVDGDLREQHIKHVLGIDKPTKGLLDIAEANASTDELLYSEEKFPFSLISGDRDSESPAKAIRSERVGEVMSELRRRYDVILIDAPPCGVFSDAAVFAKYADAVYYVVRENHEEAYRIAQAIAALEGSGAKIAGYILNMAKTDMRYGHDFKNRGKDGYGKYK